MGYEYSQKQNIFFIFDTQNQIRPKLGPEKVTKPDSVWQGSRDTQHEHWIFSRKERKTMKPKEAVLT